jgi:hypothetical protein
MSFKRPGCPEFFNKTAGAKVDFGLESGNLIRKENSRIACKWRFFRLFGDSTGLDGRRQGRLEYGSNFRPLEGLKNFPYNSVDRWI